MQTRIYKVWTTKETTEAAGRTRLIEASSAAQAIRHIVAGEFAAQTASPKEVATLMKAGIAVEIASAPAPAQDQ